MHNAIRVAQMKRSEIEVVFVLRESLLQSRVGRVRLNPNAIIAPLIKNNFKRIGGTVELHNIGARIICTTSTVY